MHAKLLHSCLILCDPMDCSPPNFSVDGNFPDKNIGVGCHGLSLADLAHSANCLAVSHCAHCSLNLW